MTDVRFIADATNTFLTMMSLILIFELFSIIDHCFEKQMIKIDLMPLNLSQKDGWVCSFWQKQIKKTVNIRLELS